MEFVLDREQCRHLSDKECACASIDIFLTTDNECFIAISDGIPFVHV